MSKIKHSQPITAPTTKRDALVSFVQKIINMIEAGEAWDAGLEAVDLRDRLKAGYFEDLDAAVTQQDIINVMPLDRPAFDRFAEEKVASIVSAIRDRLSDPQRAEELAKGVMCKALHLDDDARFIDNAVHFDLPSSVTRSGVAETMSV